MFPSEMAVLMALATARESVNALPNRPWEAHGDYVAHLYSSLVRHGYLKEIASRKYQLTEKGNAAIRELLNRNGTRASDLMLSLQKLGIETGEGTALTQKESVG